MLATYEGENEKLRQQINQFKVLYESCCKATISAVVKRRVLPQTEALLISIINTASNGVAYDKTWLTANRIEIDAIFTQLRSIRQNCFPAHAEDPKQKSVIEDLHRKFADPREIFGTKEIEEAAGNTAQKIYGSITATTALTATGASAASFLAGPVVGAAVTGTVAIVSFSSAAAITLNRKKKAKNDAPKNVEASMRKKFTY